MNGTHPMAIGLLAVLMLAGCTHGVTVAGLGAGAPRSLATRSLAEPDMDAMERQFHAMTPAAKATFLRKMTPAVKKSWDAYQAARQLAFQADHPPVAPLGEGVEQALRQALRTQYPNRVEKTNLKAPVDVDGAGPTYGDKWAQALTSISIGGKALDADAVLYHVTKVGQPQYNGMLAIHFYGGRMVPSIFGDAGPALGEASHLVVQSLGIPSSPISGGTDKGHDMILLPGLGTAFMATKQQPTPENLATFCRERGVPGFAAPPPGLSLAF